MISTNRITATRRESEITDTTAQLKHTMQVFSPRCTLVSPRTWGKPPVGPNMLILRGRHPGRASRVLAAEATSAFGCSDLAAPTERDLQRLVGNTIDKNMAGATVERTHPRLIRFAIDSAASATVAVLRTVPSTPSLLTPGGNPPARPRFASGLPPDTATLHATFGQAPHNALRATCAAYSLTAPKAATVCTTCATSNMRKAPTYHSSGSPTQHTTGSSWSGDMIGQVCAQIFSGATYGLQLTKYNTYCEYFSGLRSKSASLEERRTRRNRDVVHTTMTAAGARPHLLTTDLGGEFVGQAADRLHPRLGIAH